MIALGEEWGWPEPGPAFQWYPKDWLGDSTVLQMSWEARAMHMHCICIAWQMHPRCSLPDEALQWRRWCGWPKDENWDQLLTEIRAAWKQASGRWWQKRLLRVYLDQVSHSRARRAAAEARWGKKKAREGGDAMHVVCIDNAHANDMHAGEGVGEEVGEGEEEGAGGEGEKISKRLPPEVEALGDLLQQAEARQLAHLLAHPEKIDPAGKRSPDVDDEKAMRTERLHLLAAIAVMPGANGVPGHPFGNWRSWREVARRKGRGGSADWKNEVYNCLRPIYDHANGDGAKARAALIAADVAGTGWRSWKPSYGEEERARGSQRPLTGAEGWLAPGDDGIDC
jgi:uncharacterized protein YdaU (DUF1376 family)